MQSCSWTSLLIQTDESMIGISKIINNSRQNIPTC